MECFSYFGFLVSYMFKLSNSKHALFELYNFFKFHIIYLYKFALFFLGKDFIQIFLQ